MLAVNLAALNRTALLNLTSFRNQKEKMSIKISQRHCAKCGQATLAQKQTPNHILHFLITVFTCGFWIFVWGILILACATDNYVCPRCGSAC